MLVNAAYSYGMPTQAMATSTLLAVTVAERMIGSTGSGFVVARPSVDR